MHPSISLSLYLSVSLSLYLSTYLSIYLSLSPSIHPSIHPARTPPRSPTPGITPPSSTLRGAPRLWIYSRPTPTTYTNLLGDNQDQDGPSAEMLAEKGVWEKKNPSIHPSIDPSIHPSIHPPTHPASQPAIHPPTHPPSQPSIHPSISLSLSVCLSSYLAIQLSSYLSSCLFIFLSFCQYVYLSVYLFAYLSVYPSIHLPIDPTDHPSTYLSLDRSTFFLFIPFFPAAHKKESHCDNKCAKVTCFKSKHQWSFGSPKKRQFLFSSFPVGRTQTVASCQATRSRCTFTYSPPNAA